jgi:uncharacterized protein DUF6498
MGLLSRSTLPRVVQALGVNSVPLLGFAAAEWTQGTALALYWVENLVGALLVGVRIALHRRWTGKRGHERPPEGLTSSAATVRGARGHRPPAAPPPRRSGPPGTFLREFMTTVLAFTFGHGVFVAALIFLVLPQHGERVDPDALRLGVMAVTAFLLLGFAWDLFSLRQRPFAWVRRLTEQTLGRVVLLHLAIIFGMLALAKFGAPRALFLVFAGLKTLADVGSAMPQRELPVEPPAWAKAFSRRVSSPDGEDFASYWRRTEAAARAERAVDEEVLPAGR